MKYKLRSRCCVKNIKLNQEEGIIDFVNDIMPATHHETKIDKTIRMDKNKNREEINKAMKKNQLK